MARIELPLARREFIADLAEDVWVTFSGERQAFLDGIAEAASVGLTYADFEDAFDGIIEHKFGRFHIFCNIAKDMQANFPRVRFTLAHELGHYFIDEHRNALAAGKPPHPSFPDRPSENPAEHEANHFASHLLMPKKEFRAALIESQNGIDGIRNLASTFNVSAQCAALRYVAGCEKSCAIVMFRDGAKPWFDVSPEMEKFGLTHIRVSKNQIPHDSATGMAHRDPKNKFNNPHTNMTLASAWFVGVSQGSRNDFFLHEFSVRLGGFGVLTLLEMK
ncbi:MAG TPA: ImmA/IrrE family metallo-endopeptidase [Verrucomicrobiae bacterium]